ncbi:MAG: LacI family DNA-binding transcriptional regulator [Burkholderiales bacterium]
MSKSTRPKTSSSDKPATKARAIQPRDPKRPVTSYDVALRAGISQSAVSRCFKQGASVSSAMRARVMKAARELEYTPNAMARSLITRRSNLVGVLISNLTNLYYPEVLSELCQQFGGCGQNLGLSGGSSCIHTKIVSAP